MAMLKRLVKRSLPAPVLRLVRLYKNREFNNLSTEQIFTRIYERGAWGRPQNPARPFFSGTTGRGDEETAGYVRAVGDFLCSFPVKPNIVDLGCGDFMVGSQIRKFCGRYIACDVVPGLIDFNKRQFEDLDVEFKLLDLVKGRTSCRRCCSHPASSPASVERPNRPVCRARLELQIPCRDRAPAVPRRLQT
jgi:hypothetical protein